MRILLILLLIFCPLLSLSSLSEVHAGTSCAGLSAKEKIQFAPVIFKGAKEESDFHIITVYKGQIEKGGVVSVKESANLPAGREYIVFAGKNLAGELSLDECEISFERSSVSENANNAEILAELEIFKAQVEALEDVEESFPQAKGGTRSWAMEMGGLLQEYGDDERALEVYRQEIASRYNLLYNRKTETMEKREPFVDPFAWHEKTRDRRGPPERYDAIREELKEYSIVLTRLGRYEEALVPLEMAILSGVGADVCQLYFESALKSKGKEYFNGRKIRLDQVRDRPNYEVNGVDLSDIKITFSYTADTTFNGVDFSGSDLSGSRFNSSVVFKSTNFTGAKLENVEFKQTKYDGDTIWPETFNPGDHGLVLYSEEMKEQ